MNEVQVGSEDHQELIKMQCWLAQLLKQSVSKYMLSQVLKLGFMLI